MSDLDRPTGGPALTPGWSLHPDRLYLHCVKGTVDTATVLADPLLMAAVVDDICLSIATADWFTRLPGRWQRAERRRWDAEGERLRREGARLGERVVRAVGP
jgi:hypothetical protein